MEPLLRTVDLTRHFRVGGMLGAQVLHAVDDFSFSIEEREIVALVGESGKWSDSLQSADPRTARDCPPLRRWFSDRL